MERRTHLVQLRGLVLSSKRYDAMDALSDAKRDVNDVYLVTMIHNLVPLVNLEKSED